MMTSSKSPNRIELPYANDSKQWRFTSEDIDKFQKRQYIFLYRIRIDLLRGRILSTADHTEKETKNELIVGVIFKRMKYRQSVLYEFADDSNLNMDFIKGSTANLTDEEDVLEIEEDDQIIKLEGNIDKHLFVTGDVIGLLGTQAQSNGFVVKEIILPGLAEQIPWPIIEKNCYVAFMSGILLTGDMGKSARTLMALDAFQKWINGEMIPDDEEECEIVQNVARLVIAGDLVRANPIEVECQKIAQIGMEYDADEDGFAQFDRFLCRLLQNLPVDLMPGPNDPAQCMIPQQPIPSCVFEAGDRFRPMLNTVTNPYRFSLAGLQLVGTSGQNVNDLARLTRIKEPLERMERTLRMSHLFPTVPDTLSGFPFPQTRDPLVLDQIPHIYFCGNQPSFQHKLLELDTEKKRSLLLAIPKFYETFEVVLLNLRTLEAMPYSFKVDVNLKLSSL